MYMKSVKSDVLAHDPNNKTFCFDYFLVGFVSWFENSPVCSQKDLR